MTEPTRKLFAFTVSGQITILDTDEDAATATSMRIGVQLQEQVDAMLAKEEDVLGGGVHMAAKPKTVLNISARAAEKLSRQLGLFAGGASAANGGAGGEVASIGRGEGRGRRDKPKADVVPIGDQPPA